mmetsp:Transcript_7969/g.17266  ORF Transcript_7969/g.17266 Transcript_7969/m.17266 type:complete len:86 (-) Transcript_7969:351-608(-)
MDEFTAEQIKRMHASWDLFRDIGEGGGGVSNDEEPTQSPSKRPSDIPTSSPTSKQVCDAPGSPCRRKKFCCSGKCHGKKKEKVCR